jgi:serine/threonine-protein kinase
LKSAALTTLNSMLQLNLEPDTFQVLAASGTSVSSAYRHYLQGLGFLERFDRKGNVQQAIQEFNMAVQDDPLFATAYASLAEALRIKFQETNNGDWLDSADEACEQALALNDQLAVAYISCGSVQLERGRYQEALQQYHTAVMLDPTDGDAYRGVANTQAALGNIEEAEAIWQEAINLKPDYWLAHFRLGYFLMQHGRYKEALGPLRTALSYVPNNYRVYNNIGTAHLYQMHLEAAIEAFQSSVAIEPNYAAYSNLATARFYQHEYSAAAEMYELALQYRDSDYRVWAGLARACELTPERAHEAKAFYMRAVELAEEILQVNPRRAEVAVHLAQYYQVLDQNEPGREMLDYALSLQTRNPELMVRLAKLCEKLGRREEAIDLIANAVENGFPYSQIEASTTLEELRNDEAFLSRLRQMDLTDEL